MHTKTRTSEILSELEFQMDAYNERKWIILDSVNRCLGFIAISRTRLHLYVCVGVRIAYTVDLHQFVKKKVLRQFEPSL